MKILSYFCFSTKTNRTVQLKYLVVFMLSFLFFLLIVPRDASAAAASSGGVCYYNDTGKRLQFCGDTVNIILQGVDYTACRACTQRVFFGYHYTSSVPLYICKPSADCYWCPQNMPSTILTTLQNRTYSKYQNYEYTTYILVYIVGNTQYVGAQYACNSLLAFKDCQANKIPDYTNPKYGCKKLFDN